MWGLSILFSGCSPEFSTFAHLSNYSTKSCKFLILDETKYLIIILEKRDSEAGYTMAVVVEKK